jgi:hypothetical protein
MIHCPTCGCDCDESIHSRCPQCGQRFQLSGLLNPASFSAAIRPKIPCKVDLAITVDATGSSQAFEKGIPMTVEIVLKQVSARAPVRIWTQEHRDLEYGENMLLLTDGGNVEQALGDIRSIRFHGGGDPHETHLDAIENLLHKVPWTADPSKARGAILALLTSETKPLRCGRSPRELGEELKRQGILLYLVSERTPRLHELVEAAEGLIFPITNQPDPGVLQKIASQVAASIIATTASGLTVPMTVPETVEGS